MKKYNNNSSAEKSISLTRIRLLFRSFLCVLSVLVVFSVHANESDVSADVNIAEQSLDDALLKISKIYHVSIVLGDAELKKIVSSSFSGHFTLAEILQKLLADTKFSWRYINSNALVVERLPVEAEVVEDLGPELEEILVVAQVYTGSHLHRQHVYEVPVLQQLLATDLNRGNSRPASGRFKQLLPSASGNGINTGVSNGGDGSASLSLRGLAPSYTLILLNGDRVASSMRHGASIDLNVMPLSLASNVDVLANGASALYGADAVAGAVNIITEKEFDGFKFSQTFGQSSRNDLDSNQTEFTFGHLWDEYSLLFSFSRYQQEGLYTRQRGISADQRSLGGVDLRSSATPNSRIYLDDGQVVTPTPGVLSDAPLSEKFQSVQSEDKFDFADHTTAVLPLEQQSLLINAGTLTSADIHFDFTVNHNKSWAENTRAPEPLFSNAGYPEWSVAADNKFNLFGDAVQDIRRRLLEMGPRIQTHNKENINIKFQASQPFKLSGAPWLWQASLGWSEAESSEEFSNLASSVKLQRSAGSSSGCVGVSVDGCEPIDLFSPVGSISSGALDYIRSRMLFESEDTLANITAQIEGDLFSIGNNLPIKSVFGVSYRLETSWENTLEADSVANSRYRGKRSVSELFSEFNVPLLDDRLELQMASRYAYYSDFGDNFSPSIAANYTLLKSFAVRGGYSQGYAAPNLFEMHSAGGIRSMRLEDPCSIPENQALLAGCLKVSDPEKLQHITNLLGNKNLQPETSEHFNLGFKWSPENMSAFSLSADFYSIQIDDVIAQMSPQDLVEQAAQGYVQKGGGFVSRNSDGNISLISSSYINSGTRRVDSIDYRADAVLSTDTLGDWAFSLQASQLVLFLDQSGLDFDDDNLVGTYSPEVVGGNGALPMWKGWAQIGWRSNEWSLNYQGFYIDSMLEDIPYQDQQRKIDHWFTHNLEVSYSPAVLESLSFVVGVENILDNPAPFVASSFNNGLDARTHNLTGRYYYTQLNLSY